MSASDGDFASLAKRWKRKTTAAGLLGQSKMLDRVMVSPLNQVLGAAGGAHYTGGELLQDNAEPFHIFENHEAAHLELLERPAKNGLGIAALHIRLDRGEWLVMPAALVQRSRPTHLRIKGSEPRCGYHPVAEAGMIDHLATDHRAPSRAAQHAPVFYQGRRFQVIRRWPGLDHPYRGQAQVDMQPQFRGHARAPPLRKWGSKIAQGGEAPMAV